jgi:uncharacterized protein YyaL (SSP411 family)
LALLKLAAITGTTKFREVSEAVLQNASERLYNLPQALTYLLLALDFAQEEPRRATIVAEVDSAAINPLLVAVHRVYQHNKIVLSNTGPVEPFARSLPVNPPAVYVCTGTHCQAPTADPQEIERFLR